MHDMDLHEDQSLDLLSKSTFLEKAPTLNHCKDLKLSNQKKCYICLKGDEHLGSKYHDIELHKDVINQLLDKPNLYVILMGDALETATKDSVGAGIFEQDNIVQEQLEAYVELHKPLAKAGKILGIHVGNHEWRVFKHSGLNITKQMVSLLNSEAPNNIKYFGHGIFHYLTVGSQSYTMYTVHGGSGAIKVTGKLNAVLNLATFIDADLYAMGHTHGLGYQTLEQLAVDKRNKTVVTKEKYFVNTGSFLSHWGSYAHMKSYAPMKKGSPIVELSGEAKKIKIWI